MRFGHQVTIGLVMFLCFHLQIKLLACVFAGLFPSGNEVALIYPFQRSEAGPAFAHHRGGSSLSAIYLRAFHELIYKVIWNEIAMCPHLYTKTASFKKSLSFITGKELRDFKPCEEM